MKKRVIILGVTGQDGSYMAELLLKKQYVIGIMPFNILFNDYVFLLQNPFYQPENLSLHLYRLA